MELLRLHIVSRLLLLFPGVVPHWIAPIPQRQAANPMHYSYGAYCGSYRIKNPWQMILAQDCVDDCCRVHDKCVDAHSGAGYSQKDQHACCEANVGCISNARASNCCKKSRLSEQQCCTAGANVQSAMNITAAYYGAPSKPCLATSEYDYFTKVWWGNPRAICPIHDPAKHPE